MTISIAFTLAALRSRIPSVRKTSRSPTSSQLLDAMVVIECYAERESRGQLNAPGAALPNQDRRGMSGVHDSCDTGGMVDPYDLPGHKVAIIGEPV